MLTGIAAFPFNDEPFSIRNTKKAIAMEKGRPRMGKREVDSAGGKVDSAGNRKILTLYMIQDLIMDN